jgi:WD40 repeat protein
LYEHSASVTAIEKNFKDNKVFATAGRDQKVFIWELPGEQGKEEVEFITEIGKQQFFKPGGSSLNLGHVTSLKWYDENTLALSLTNGTL